MERRQRAGAISLLMAGAALLALGFVIARPYLQSLLYMQRIPMAPPLDAPLLEQRPTQTSEPMVLMPFNEGVEEAGATVAPTPPVPVDEDASGTVAAVTATPRADPPPVTPEWIGVSPTQLSIPDIDLEAPVVSIGWETVQVRGTRQAMWQVPEWRAAGWHETSARLGVTGNTVLNGHNSGDGEVFRNLYKVAPGAQVFVTGEDDKIYVYRVAEKYILREAGQPIEVRLENARYIQETGDERLTLVTCHPYGSLANRLILIAYPVQDGDRVEKGVS